MVLAARRGGNQAATDIKSLKRGSTVRLSWTIGRRRVMDVMGGSPTLVKGRKIVLEPCDADFCDRNPRTGIGVTGEGKVLLVTVDGRQPGYSVGISILGFAHLFKHLGATAAINLDGGGSATMVVRGRIVNRPSDSPERAVSSSVLVLPRADRDEPDPVPAFEAPAVTGSETRSPARPRPRSGGPARHVPDPATADAASTGGFLDALSRGQLQGAPRGLPDRLERVAKAYRRLSDARPNGR